MNNKLQLINSEKLDRLLNAYEEDRKKRKLIENATDPTLKELVESEENLHKSGSINLKEAAVIQFKKKRQKYKKEHENNKEDGVKDQGGPIIQSKERIEKFLKDKKIRFASVNQEDLIEDLSRQSRKKFNLHEDSQRVALNRLWTNRMPASYINNPILKKQYIELSKKTGESSSSLIRPAVRRSLRHRFSDSDDEEELSYRTKRRS